MTHRLNPDAALERRLREAREARTEYLQTTGRAQAVPMAKRPGRGSSAIAAAIAALLSLLAWRRGAR